MALALRLYQSGFSFMDPSITLSRYGSATMAVPVWLWHYEYSDNPLRIFEGIQFHFLTFDLSPCFLSRRLCPLRTPGEQRWWRRRCFEPTRYGSTTLAVPL